MSLSEDGADVLHTWIDTMDAKMKKHSKRSAHYQLISLSSRTFLLIVTGILACVALIRAAVFSSQLEFVYGLVLVSVFLLLVTFFGLGTIDKSTFHLRMSHELHFMKAKCQMMLAERKSPEIIRKEYEGLMTRSNKLMNLMN